MTNGLFRWLPGVAQRSCRQSLTIGRVLFRQGSPEALAVEAEYDSY